MQIYFSDIYYVEFGKKVNEMISNDEWDVSKFSEIKENLLKKIKY
jgi:hypothetical protein